jgi:uncharacterized repeat protein (TIGR01451 family)
MNSVMQRFLRTSAALGALGLAFVSTTAHAVGTPANTQISNSATVQFRIGNADQTPVTSAPALFRVDRVVNFATATTNGSLVTLNPGQTDAFVSFTVSHSGNDAQGFALAATNTASGTTVLTGVDNADVPTLEVWHHPTNASAAFTPANPAGGGFVLGNINTLAPNSTAVVWPVYVRVVAPITLTDTQVVGVRLEARGAVAGTSGATLETASTGADDPNVVDVVIATAGNAASVISGFRVQGATVAVSKSSIVVSDPFSTSNPKAIPGAVVEYRVVATNTGGAAAQRVGFTDAVPALTTFAAAGYGASANVEIRQGTGTPATCFAEPTTDTNGDGCFLAGTTLTVVPTGSNAITLSAGGPNAAVEFRFRVTVN